MRLSFRCSSFKPCVDEVTAAVYVASALSLASNRYETTNDLESEAKIALDVAEMRESKSNRDKKDIYLHGRNSRFQNEAGVFVNRSLASLSLNSVREMNQDHMYNIFRNSFGRIGLEEEHEPDGNFDGLPVEEYANTVVLDLFCLNKGTEIEIEAALIMNVWMKIVHELDEAVRACRDRNTTDSGLRNLDTAAAFWIGIGQKPGDSKSGNLLYNLAEKAGEKFRQDRSSKNNNSETSANQKIIDYMNHIKNEIIHTGKCMDGALVEYQMIVQKIIGQMTVPLVQQLIYHLMQPGAARSRAAFIELYALSILPRIEECDREKYKFFLNRTVMNEFHGNAVEFITNDLQPMYSCLGITCEDVGTYVFEELPHDNTGEVFARLGTNFMLTYFLFFLAFLGAAISALTLRRALLRGSIESNVSSLTEDTSPILRWELDPSNGW